MRFCSIRKIRFKDIEGVLLEINEDFSHAVPVINFATDNDATFGSDALMVQRIRKTSFL